jgi:hypothetical protein
METSVILQVVNSYLQKWFATLEAETGVSTEVSKKCWEKVYRERSKKEAKRVKRGKKRDHDQRINEIFESDWRQFIDSQFWGIMEEFEHRVDRNQQIIRWRKNEEKCETGGFTRKLCTEQSCPCCFFRSLAFHFKCKQFKIIPREVIRNTPKQIKYDCDTCPHSSEMAGNNLSAGYWCPYCTNQIVCGNKECLTCIPKTLFVLPRIVKCWSKSNDTSPEQILKGSKTKIELDCDTCCHSFETSARDLSSRNQWCPYCAKFKGIVCGSKECKSCVPKTFLSVPKIANIWSVKNVLLPEQVRKGTGMKVKLNCTVCFHEFETAGHSLTSGVWCPYCAKNKGIVCGSKECKSCVPKTFFSIPTIVARWSKDNLLAPEQVMKGTDNKIKIDCHICAHTFERAGNELSHNQRCPYCAKRNGVICGKVCKTCIPKTLYMVQRAVKCWSSENLLLPEQVTKGVREKVKIICDICHHTFKITPGHLAGGRWCPCVKRKTERKVKDFLVTSSFSFSQGCFYPWCTNSSTRMQLPFDFSCDTLHVIIEVDGRQHFHQVSNWLSPQETNQRDRYKVQQALSHGYSVIRILQEDVWHDRIDWKTLLTREIERCSQLSVPELVFINYPEEYRRMFENPISEVEIVFEDEEVEIVFED